MIIDLIKNTYFRGFSFEIIAKKYLRRIHSNAFIFQTTEFKDLKSSLQYYRINIKTIPNFEVLSKYLKYLDLIEITLDSLETRNVQEIILYEVKSKVNHRNRPVDMSRYFYNTCRLLSDKGFTLKLVYIQMFPNWKFSLEIFDFFKFKNYMLRGKREIKSGLSH